MPLRISFSSVSIPLRSNNGSQCGIALDGLRRTDTAVFGVETPFEQVVQVVLDTGRCFSGIIIQVVNVDVAQLVCLGILLGQQIFVGVILGDFRSERHHLSGWCMA